MVASVKLTNVPKVGLRLRKQSLLFSQANSQCCVLMSRSLRGRSQSLPFPSVTLVLWSKFMMYSRTCVEESFRWAMTTQGGWSRLQLQTTYRLPLWVMALSIRCLQRSQLRSYQQYSQAGLEQCLDFVLIHRFRHVQWIFLTDPEHWHRLKRGLRSPSSLPKHTLQNYSPQSPPHESRDALLNLKGDFSSLLRRSIGDWWTRRQELPRLILSAMSMSESVLRFSCMSISLKRWQIFLMTNSRSAKRIMLPSYSA